MKKSVARYRGSFAMPIYFFLFAILFGYSASAQTISKPTVQVGTEKHVGGGTPEEKLYFKCSFTPSSDSSLLYRVYWYVDGQTVYTSSLVTATEMVSTHLKSENGLRLPSQISCAIQTKLRSSDIGHMSPRSDDFFAGIQTVPSTVYLERGGIISVGLYLTVPFGCPYQHPHDQESENCHMEIAISTSRQSYCDIHLVLQDGCSVRLQRREWNIIQHITLRDINDRYPMTSFGLTLSTSNSYGAEWHNFHQNVTVNTIESNGRWKGKTCTTQYPGVHLKTFSNRSFEITQTGTFLLYRSHTDEYRMEVAIKTKSCSKGVCICGIAAIAGGDIFFTDYCQLGHFPAVGFIKCQHNLIAVKRMTASSHMIFFPTGTQVLLQTLLVDGYVMEVDVSPSVHDVHGTEGLCGRLGSSQLITNNGIVSSVDDFIQSWGTVDLNTIKSSGYTTPIAPSGSQFCICESGMSKPNCTHIPFLPYYCRIGTREFLSGQCSTNEVFG